MTAQIGDNAEPMRPDELSEFADYVREGHPSVQYRNVLRLLATIAARDEEIARLESKRLDALDQHRGAHEAWRDLMMSMRTVERERDAYRKAKQENDDRFMSERDEARAHVAQLEALIPAARAYATHNPIWYCDDNGELVRQDPNGVHAALAALKTKP